MLDLPDARSQAKGAVRLGAAGCHCGVEVHGYQHAAGGALSRLAEAGRGVAVVRTACSCSGVPCAGRAMTPRRPRTATHPPRERFERRIEVVLLGPLGPMGDPTWT